MHGLSVPLLKIGYHLPRTLSTAITSRSIGECPGESRPPFRVYERIQSTVELDHQMIHSSTTPDTREEPHRLVFGTGGSIIQPAAPENGIVPQNIDVIKERASYSIESPKLDDRDHDRVDGHYPLGINSQSRLW